MSDATELSISAFNDTSSALEDFQKLNGDGMRYCEAHQIREKLLRATGKMTSLMDLIAGVKPPKVGE